MEPNELLLKAIAARQQKLTEFNGGILTADRYVRSIQDCVGSDACYKYAATKAASFDDILKKSAKTLTYNNSDMVVEDLYGKPGEWKSQEYVWADKDGDVLELPKNTLMVFKHTLTTPRKDRDGDIMRTQGAKPDPKMLLLWQHVHTLPIGKMLAIAEHNSKRLSIVSAIIDMNELCHDAAVMIDNDMGRFSHGFRALEFSKIKEGSSEEEGGFDVKLFEIMEESLVSVPSNVDAEVDEVILALAESGKLTSPMMKSIGHAIRVKRPKRVSVGTDVSKLTIDLDIKINGKTIGEEHEASTSIRDAKCTGHKTCDCGCQGKPTSAPAKTNGDAAREAEDTDDKEVTCPKCGERMVDGVCEKCGYEMGKSTKTGTKAVPAYVYTGQLEKSYEAIGWALRSGLTSFLEKNGVALTDGAGKYYYYADVLGTYPDHAIVSVQGKDGNVYYKAAWKDGTNGPEFYGALKEVRIETTTTILEKAHKFGARLSEKSGRTLNGKNQENLTHAYECVQEVHDKEDGLTKGGKSLCREAIKCVKDVLGSAEKPKPEADTKPDAKTAAEIFLMEATPEQRAGLKAALDAMAAVDGMQEETKEILALLG